MRETQMRLAFVAFVERECASKKSLSAPRARLLKTVVRVIERGSGMKRSGR